MEYILHLFIIVCIYIMLSQSLSLSAQGGLISLAHAGFYGIGAYSAAILSTEYQLSFLIILFIALLCSGFLAVLVASIALRTMEDYFIICTLGIQAVVFSIMNNWMQMTNGPLGISGIPTLTILRFPTDNKILFLFIVVIFVLATHFLIKYLTTTAFGLTLRSISEDEIYTASIGKNVYLTKLISFTISGMLASIPGVFYAYYISYVAPVSFTINESIFILSIVIIGGLRNLQGIAYATIFLILLPEVLRFIGLPNAIAANIRQIIYGLMLIIVVFRNARNEAS